MSTEDSELDPRIQIELENLNSATDEINKLEIELEEANTTFRILLNESTRRLKLLSKKLGNCIEKARPYYEALEKSREAQIECQKSAVKFQRANEIHMAAKETVALAEQRFMSNSHEWKFDNAWQEMLNHATQKVMDAEKQKADCHAEHQKRTKIFHAAEQKVQQLEERFRRSIAKSRPYFEEKQICQDQLQTQKNRIHELQALVQSAKSTYSTALRNLERISNDIHRQRGDFPEMTAPPPGPREPGVGAELNSPTTPTTSAMPSLPDFELELEKCDYPSIAGSQISLGGSSYMSHDTTTSSAAPLTGGMVGMALAVKGGCDLEEDEDEQECIGDNEELAAAAAAVVDEKDLEALRQKMKILAVRPIEGGDGQQEQNDMWEHELKATVDKLDHLMLLNECALKQQQHHQQHDHKFKPLRPDSLGAEAPQLHHPDADEIDHDHDDDGDVIVVAGTAGPLIKVTATSASATASTRYTSTSYSNVDGHPISLPGTPEHMMRPIKTLQKLAPLPSVNVSMRELPLLARLSNEILDQRTAAAAASAVAAATSPLAATLTAGYGQRQQQRRRSLD